MEEFLKAIFLDRDGTIVKDYSDAEWPRIQSLELIPAAVTFLQAKQAEGYKFIFMTNQYLIGEGIISYMQFQSMHGDLVNRLKFAEISILDTFYCPHSRQSNCNCCKPKPGLLQQAISKYPEIDVSHLLYIGDRDSDEQAAQSMNIKFIRVKTNGFL